MPRCRKAALSPFFPLFGIAATDDIKSTKPTPDQNATCTLKEGVVLSGAWVPWSGLLFCGGPLARRLLLGKIGHQSATWSGVIIRQNASNIENGWFGYHVVGNLRHHTDAAEQRRAQDRAQNQRDAALEMRAEPMSRSACLGGE